MSHRTDNRRSMNALSIRNATLEDLDFVVSLIGTDPIADARIPATSDDQRHQREAFDAINRDPNHLLLVADWEHQPVGSFQLSFIPGVSRQGAWRGQIESVRIHPEHRNRGLGSAMMEWAVERCRERGCGQVQLTSDQKRSNAHRFYERLGFLPTHTGFKLRLRG